jgi:hypothetical protein
MMLQLRPLAWPRMLATQLHQVKKNDVKAFLPKWASVERLAGALYFVAGVMAATGDTNFATSRVSTKCSYSPSMSACLTPLEK